MPVRADKAAVRYQALAASYGSGLGMFDSLAERASRAAKEAAGACMDAAAAAGVAAKQGLEVAKEKLDTALQAPTHGSRPVATPARARAGLDVDSDAVRFLVGIGVSRAYAVEAIRDGTADAVAAAALEERTASSVSASSAVSRAPPTAAQGIGDAEEVVDARDEEEDLQRAIAARLDSCCAAALPGEDTQVSPRLAATYVRYDDGVGSSARVAHNTRFAAYAGGACAAAMLGEDTFIATAVFAPQKRGQGRIGDDIAAVATADIEEREAADESVPLSANEPLLRVKEPDVAGVQLAPFMPAAPEAPAAPLASPFMHLASVGTWAVLRLL